MNTILTLVSLSSTRTQLLRILLPWQVPESHLASFGTTVGGAESMVGNEYARAWLHNLKNTVCQQILEHMKSTTQCQAAAYQVKHI